MRLKFNGHFNSWSTETELQREGRSMVFLNVLHQRRNSIHHQPRQCKCSSLISLQSICDISEVDPCVPDQRCYVGFFFTFVTSLVTHLQQKLWTAHQRRPNKWQYRQQNVAGDGLAGRQRSGTSPAGHHRSHLGEEADTHSFTFFLQHNTLLSPPAPNRRNMHVSVFFFTHKAISTVTWGLPASNLSPLISVFSPQASLRAKGAGLGIKGSSYELSASDTYKDAVRKAMFSRFTERVNIREKSNHTELGSIHFVAKQSYCEKKSF